MNLAARFLDRPLAIAPGYLDELRARILGLEAPSEPVLMMPTSGYETIAGVALVPISGVLVHGAAWGGETDYRTVSKALAAAAVDPAVRAIALYINSPGGEVSGMFELADDIYSLRGEGKPIWSILDDSAYSAAYALASAADVITVPVAGGTGSIGVVTMHIDLTGALEQAGMKVSTVQFGARKTDYYPTTSLSEDARARLQGKVDEMGEMFVSLVARNRGLDPNRVRQTEAEVFQGRAGVTNGLADAVMAPNVALTTLIAHVG